MGRFTGSAAAAAMMMRLARECALHPRAGLNTIRALSAYRRAQETLRERAEYYTDLASAQAQLACEATRHDAAFMRACVDRWMERSRWA